MNWASEENEIRPSLNQLAILKSTIGDHEHFKTLIGLYGLVIIDEEPDYYILDGSPDDLEEFSHDWSWT